MKKKKELTPVELVYLATEKARSAKTRVKRTELKRSPVDLAIDIIFIAKVLITDLTKYINTNMQEPAKRARRGTKALETLGTDFRIQSIKGK